MDWVKTHLAVNHFSVIGAPFLILFLGWALARRQEAAQRAALWWIVLFSALSIALKFTGDFAAEQAAARLEGDTALVSRHEESADQATTAVFVFGVAAAAGLFAARRGRPVPKWAALATLLAGLATGAMMARTANLGGQISHPELRNAQ